MAIEHFVSILEDAGKILGIHLPSDNKNGCLIKLPSGLEIHIEVDFTSLPRIMIASNLGSPTPGIYRENVFREALKSNGLTALKNGIFAYSQKKDALFLYTDLLLEEASGQLLAETLTLFAKKAEFWRISINQGQTPSFSETTSMTSSARSGMFGL